jgi:hypothetical protein
MFNNDVSYLYSDDYLTSPKSLEPSDKKDLFSKSPNFLEYGPLRIRVCRKTAPTLATGRRSKYILLSGDEAIKREMRREKNRVAARKLKEKRSLIEQDLFDKVKQLEDEQSNLENNLTELQSQKQNLETKVINSVPIDPIGDLLFTTNDNIPLFFDECSDDYDLFNTSITNLLNFNSDIDDDLEN